MIALRMGDRAHADERRRTIASFLRVTINDDAFFDACAGQPMIALESRCFAKGVEQGRDLLAIPQLTCDREGLLEQCRRPRKVALIECDAAGAMQRLHPFPG